MPTGHPSKTIEQSRALCKTAFAVCEKRLLTPFARLGNVAEVTALKTILIFVGLCRFIFAPINRLLENYARDRISPSQYFLAHKTEGLFWLLDWLCIFFFSFSLATANAALQVWSIGDRDLRIRVPYKAMEEQPESVPKAQNVSQT